MITRQTKIQLLVFLIISVVGVTYTGARYAELDRFFVDEGYTLKADFADSGGMFVGSEVTYRGVRVGEVTDLVLQGDGVVAEMRIDNDVDVPTGSRALVANRSAVGEQYVDLQPSRREGPFMKEGDTIPQGDPATCGRPAFDAAGTSYPDPADRAAAQPRRLRHERRHAGRRCRPAGAGHGLRGGG